MALGVPGRDLESSRSGMDFNAILVQCSNLSGPETYFLITLTEDGLRRIGSWCSTRVPCTVVGEKHGPGTDSSKTLPGIPKRHPRY